MLPGKNINKCNIKGIIERGSPALRYACGVEGDSFLLSYFIRSFSFLFPSQFFTFFLIYRHAIGQSTYISARSVLCSSVATWMRRRTPILRIEWLLCENATVISYIACGTQWQAPLVRKLDETVCSCFKRGQFLGSGTLDSNSCGWFVRYYFSHG